MTRAAHRRRPDAHRECVQEATIVRLAPKVIRISIANTGCLTSLRCWRDWLPERLAMLHHMVNALKCRFSLDQLNESGALKLEQLLLAQRAKILVSPPQSTVDNALETTTSCPVILPLAPGASTLRSMTRFNTAPGRCTVAVWAANNLSPSPGSVPWRRPARANGSW